MTPEDYASRQHAIITKAANISGPTHRRHLVINECIVAWDALEKEYAAAQQSPQERFYAAVTELDALRHTLLQSQGRPAAQRAVWQAIATMAQQHSEYSAQAEKGEGS